MDELESASGLKRASCPTVPPVELVTGRHGRIRDVVARLGLLPEGDGRSRVYVVICD